MKVQSETYNLNKARITIYVRNIWEHIIRELLFESVQKHSVRYCILVHKNSLELFTFLSITMQIYWSEDFTRTVFLLQICQYIGFKRNYSTQNDIWEKSWADFGNLSLNLCLDVIKVTAMFTFIKKYWSWMHHYSWNTCFK